MTIFTCKLTKAELELIQTLMFRRFAELRVMRRPLSPEIDAEAEALDELHEGAIHDAWHSVNLRDLSR